MKNQFKFRIAAFHAAFIHIEDIIKLMLCYMKNNRIKIFDASAHML